ncbi:MAG TPA: ADP-ribosylglycohydrolase family protein, partial [Cyclobacteriaceae bacterium]
MYKRLTLLFIFVSTMSFAQVPVIFDTDIAPDFDDVGAMALLHAFADKGEAKILATISCNTFETTVPTLSVLNDYFRRSEIPIGITKGDFPNKSCNEKWAEFINAKYPHRLKTNPDAEDALALYRKTLMSQPDNSVTIITVGFFTNLANLLNSPPDNISSLSGRDLVKKKVKHLVSMAASLGKDGNGGNEFNVVVDAKASQKVFNEWPTPIILSGFQIGEKILTGIPLINNASITNSPVKDAFDVALKKNNQVEGRCSWDQTAVYVAVRGIEPYFTSRKISFDIKDDGKSVPVKGNKYTWLEFKETPEKIAKGIEELMEHQPGEKSAGAATSITKDVLKDKIKGGWAGQTIGVTFGGPYEFRFNGTFIGDYQPLLWYNGYLKNTMINNPGLYDDLYMDITFVDIFEKNGLDASVDAFANAYAKAGYMLWHANQAGRYNLLNGMKAPESGHWLNNPHADCIDYQIESDFAGLMSPGMPNTASTISDKIGHIMNYGDGWYGGIYVGAMYSLSFVSKDVNWIVETALESVPKESEFYQAISDVIGWHKKYPNDWKQTWLEVQKRWADDIGCPEGVFVPFNIDAKVNAAYCVIGLLYGEGDFTRSMEITTRCGQDADCNPSTVGGVLGTIIGYDKIPSYWKQGLAEAESIDFKYTTMSLNKVYETGYKHAIANLERNGAKTNGNMIILPSQKIQPVRFEKSFDGHYPLAKVPVNWSANKDEIS